MSGRQILELDGTCFVTCEAITAIVRGKSSSYINGKHVQVGRFTIHLGPGSEDEGFYFCVPEEDAEATYMGLKLMMGDIHQPLADKVFTIEAVKNRGRIRLKDMAAREAAKAPEVEDKAP